MMLKRISGFIRKNFIFSLAVLLAGLSACWIPPDAAYLEYINWPTLAVLSCLMLVVGGLRETGVFSLLLEYFLSWLSSSRQLAALLILLCFFISMWVTNDVSLLTFVPFSLAVLPEIYNPEEIGKVIVLQTIAANLGSMCTPVGNPQNLYLYFRSQMTLGHFLQLLLPYTLVSLLLLAVSFRLLPAKKLIHSGMSLTSAANMANIDVRQLSILGGLFLLSLLTVIHLLDWRLTLVLTCLVMALWQPRTFRYLDGKLLLTFIAFFILVGNLGQSAAFHHLLAQYIAGREFLLALLSSQLISNVPAAVLLSGFTADYDALLLGTDIGGLGTLIASMASLISYSLYSRQYPEKQLHFLKIFTLLNLAFLLPLVALAML